jgi:hypothetical protein
MRNRIGLVAVALGVSMAACGADTPVDAVSIITDDATDVTSPGALLDGAFEIRDGCVVVVSAEEDAIVVWPSDSEVRGSDPPIVELSSGARLRLDGTQYRVGGGFVGVTPEATDCAARLGVDQVWLISGR